MFGMLQGIIGDIKVKAKEIDHQITSARYNADEEIELTKEDLKELRNLDLRVNGRWDYVDDCPKNEMGDKICKIIDKLIIILEGESNKKIVKASKKIIDICEEKGFEKELDKFVRENIKYPYKKDVTGFEKVNLNLNIECLDIKEGKIEFGIKKTQMFVIKKIRNFLRILNCCTEDNINRVIRLAGEESLDDLLLNFKDKLKESPEKEKADTKETKTKEAKADTKTPDESGKTFSEASGLVDVVTRNLSAMGVGAQ